MVCSANGHSFTIPADPRIIKLQAQLNSGASVSVGELIAKYTGVTQSEGVEFIASAEGIRTVLSKLYSLRAISAQTGNYGAGN